MEEISFNPDWPIEPIPIGEFKRQQGTIPMIVADDDPISRLAISAALDEWGFKYTLVDDGIAAMNAIRAVEGPALAILDWMMPGLDGLDICRRIRECYRTVHVILLTARRGPENLIEGLNAGANEYLMKPFDKDELLARIQVGLRVLTLEAVLVKQVNELQRLVRENEELKEKLTIPL